MQESVLASFAGFEGLRTVELGCGEGKVSLLFALRGAKTTLVDYSDKQLRNARYVAQEFEVEPDFRPGNLLQLPEDAFDRYDVSMSFGTAEHFFGEDRQAIFDVHARVLRPGGISFVWVPNRWGLLFHAGVKADKNWAAKPAMSMKFRFPGRSSPKGHRGPVCERFGSWVPTTYGTTSTTSS